MIDLMYTCLSNLMAEQMRIRGNNITIYGEGEHLKQHIQTSLSLYDRFHPSLADYQVHLAAEQATLILADQAFSLSI